MKNFWVHPTLVDFHTGKKYSGEAWAHRGKRPYRHVGPPDAATVDGLFRVENAFHRALRPGATLHTSLLGTSGLATPAGAATRVERATGGIICGYATACVVAIATRETIAARTQGQKNFFDLTDLAQNRGPAKPARFDT